MTIRGCCTRAADVTAHASSSFSFCTAALERKGIVSPPHLNSKSCPPRPVIPLIPLSHNVIFKPLSQKLLAHEPRSKGISSSRQAFEAIRDGLRRSINAVYVGCNKLPYCPQLI